MFPITKLSLFFCLGDDSGVEEHTLRKLMEEVGITQENEEFTESNVHSGVSRYMKNNCAIEFGGDGTWKSELNDGLRTPEKLSPESKEPWVSNL